jgi:hypothetical protein
MEAVTSLAPAVVAVVAAVDVAAVVVTAAVVAAILRVDELWPML